MLISIWYIISAKKLISSFGKCVIFFKYFFHKGSYQLMSIWYLCLANIYNKFALFSGLQKNISNLAKQYIKLGVLEGKKCTVLRKINQKENSSSTNSYSVNQWDLLLTLYVLSQKRKFCQLTKWAINEKLKKFMHWVSLEPTDPWLQDQDSTTEPSRQLYIC